MGAAKVIAIDKEPYRLDMAPRGYDMFKNKEDRCEKVVLTP